MRMMILMASLNYNVRFLDDGLKERLTQRATEIGPELVRRVNQMLVTIENNVKFVIPRGEHCKGKGGTTKSAVRHRITSYGGEVYVDEGIAPWFKWLVKGRGPVEAKGKENGGADALHFCIAGKDVFVKRVGPSEPNNVIGKGYNVSLPRIQSQANNMEKWLNEV